MSTSRVVSGPARGRFSAALLRAIEAMAIRDTESHWKRIPPDVAARLKPRTEHVADAFLTLLPGSDSLRMNRVIGFGHRGLADEAALDQIVTRYRQAKLERFSLLLGPGPQSSEITRWLLARGFSRRAGHTLLVRDARGPVTGTSPGVKIHRAAVVDRTTIVRIHAQCFAAPASRRRWNLAAAASRDIEHYLAFIGTTPVGVGALRVDRRLAWIGGGATLTRWRRRGVHRALIVARLRRAASRGCRWVWVETAEPVRGRPDGSRRNLLRLGFEEVCRKPSFVWTAR